MKVKYYKQFSLTKAKGSSPQEEHQALKTF